MKLITLIEFIDKLRADSHLLRPGQPHPAGLACGARKLSNQSTRSWPRHALLLVGHGATHYPDAGRPLHLQADALRPAFAQVTVGLLRGSPSLGDALGSLIANAVYIVPCFMEDGWFVRSAVPEALGLPALQGAIVRNGQALIYSAPVGVHPGLSRLLEKRATSRFPGDTRDLTLLLVGHGSARAPGRPMALHRHAASLAATGRFTRVEAAFLEEPPFVADALRGLAGETVAVIGCFMGEGGHVRQDIPALLDSERLRRDVSSPPVLDFGIIGDEPGMAEIILDQVAASGR